MLLLFSGNENRQLRRNIRRVFAYTREDGLFEGTGSIMRFRPRHTAWLAMLGILVAIVALAGVAAPPVALALVALILG